MKRFKILLVAVSFLLFAVFAHELIFGSFGEFGDGTGSKDSVWMNVTTFDTLGYEANAESVWFRIFYRTTLVYSDSIAGAGTNPGYYVRGRRAFDGTNYGEYTVKARWKIQTKYFSKSGTYTVANYVDSLTLRRWMFDPDSTKYGNIGRNVDRVRLVNDKTGYSLTQTFPTNFSSMLISSGGYVSPNFSDISGTLDSTEFGSNMRGAFGLWTWTLYATRALTGTQSGVTIPTVTAVSNAVTITSNSDITGIKAKTDKLIFDTNDSLIIDYGRVPTGSGTDSATESRLIRRIVYGGVGNGSDSSTLAQRTVTLQSIANNVITAASIASNALAYAKFAADYWALTNWTGTWAQTQYSTAFWHNVALSSDSLTLVTMASLLGGKGNRMLDWYNGSGKLDSVRYYNNATLVSRLIFYRPTATSAPDSMKMISY